MTVIIGFLLEDSFELEMISFSRYKMKKYLICNSYVYMYLLMEYVYFIEDVHTIIIIAIITIFCLKREPNTMVRLFIVCHYETDKFPSGILLYPSKPAALGA